MILCPTCLHAVSDELERCPFCSEELEGAEETELDEVTQWKIIRTVSTEIEARLIAGRLRAYGVPAFVLSQVDSTRNFTVGALAIAKIFIPDTRMAEADAILSGPPDDPAFFYPQEHTETERNDEDGGGDRGEHGDIDQPWPQP